MMQFNMENQPVINPEEIHLFKMQVIAEKINKALFAESKENNLGVAHKIMHNLEDQRVKIELVFSFKNQSDQETAFFQIDYQYQIDNMSNFYNIKENGKPIFSAQMIACLLGIGLSTSRGIIFERLEREGIKDIILPVVSPQKMLNKKI